MNKYIVQVVRPVKLFCRDIKKSLAYLDAGPITIEPTLYRNKMYSSPIPKQ